MSDLSGVKVGDRLFVKAGHYDKGAIHVVERLTPSGRVITKHATFNPDGSRRGDTGGWSRCWARPATDDDIAGVVRWFLLSKLGRFQWEKLNADDLKQVGEIIKKYEVKAESQS